MIRALENLLRDLRGKRHAVEAASAANSKAARRIDSASAALKRRSATDEERERQALEYIRRARHAGAAE